MRGAVGRGVGAALAAGLALTGCGDVSPGAAATVDGTTISMESVDDTARSVCVAEVTYARLRDQEWQPTPTSVYRDIVLALLVNEQLALEVADQLEIDVPPSSYEPAENPQLTDLLDALSASDRASFEDYLETFGRLQALYSAIGAEQGAVGDNKSAAAGQKAVVAFAEDRDIELDPRFGNFTGGQVVGGSGSLSVSVDGSDAGNPAAPDDPPDVAGLPDSQICQ